MVVDTQEYNHFQTNLNFERRFSASQIGIGADYTLFGNLDRIIKDQPDLTKYDIKYHGLHALSFYYRHHFELDDTKKKIAIEAATRGSPLKRKDSNGTDKGTDLIFSFHYSYDYKNIRFYGKLTSAVNGKSRNQKIDGEIETIYPYSEFGNLIGIQFLMNRQWLDLSGEFHLTTDYRSESASYSRLTDKGFILALNVTYGINLSDTTSLILSHKRSGKNFNLIAEDKSEEKEFEIESHSTILGMKWYF